MSRFCFVSLLVILAGCSDSTQLLGPANPEMTVSYEPISVGNCYPTGTNDVLVGTIRFQHITGKPVSVTGIGMGKEAVELLGPFSVQAKGVVLSGPPEPADSRGKVFTPMVFVLEGTQKVDFFVNFSIPKSLKTGTYNLGVPTFRINREVPVKPEEIPPFVIKIC